ncbi:MAG: hypothetical protein ACR2GO_03765 [Candidatus Limnocylindria bacterium]
MVIVDEHGREADSPVWVVIRHPTDAESHIHTVAPGRGYPTEDEATRAASQWYADLGNFEDVPEGVADPLMWAIDRR